MLYSFIHTQNYKVLQTLIKEKIGKQIFECYNYLGINQVERIEHLMYQRIPIVIKGLKYDS